MEKHIEQKAKFIGLGLILGVAFGFGFGLIISNPIYAPVLEGIEPGLGIVQN